MKKIKKIQFKNFRVYRDFEFVINTEKNIVLLYGNNGFGKTSFFDGIEWGLTGKLERYSGSSKEKNEYPILKNYLSEKNEKGYVNIELSDETCIKREINSKNSSDYNEGSLMLDNDTFNEITTKEAFKDKVDFCDSFNFSHLLSQELLNNFIRGTKDTDRYKAIVRIFRLERYEKFNPHLKMMKDKIDERLDKINKSIVIINNKIEIEKVKSSKIEIDPTIKMKEIKLLLEEVNFNNIEQIDNDLLEKVSKYCQKEKIELEKNLEKINQNIEEFNYLSENFNEKEESNNLLNLKKKLLQACNSNIELIEYYNSLSYINSNFKIYNDYINNKDLYNNTLVKYKEFKIGLLNNPLFVDTKFDSNLRYIQNLDQKYKTIIEKYNATKKSKGEIEQEIIVLERQLKEKYGLEKKLIMSAQDFLKENLNLKNCPVCQNNFNLSDTLDLLESRLMTEYLPHFNELIDEIEEKRKINTQNKGSIEEVELQLKNIIISIKESILNTKIDYEAQVKKINEKSEVVNKILSKATLYNLSIDEDFTKSEGIRIENIIMSGKLNEDIKYYYLLKQEINKNIISLEDDMKKYLNIKKKHNIEDITEIELITERNKDDFTKMSVLVTKYTKIILVGNELLENIKNTSTKEFIDRLTSERSVLNAEIVAFSTIKIHYEDILKSVRKVIENETKNTLNKYLKSIRKIYSYLNPHLYLNSFDIKIDDANPQNNRLVFEVSNDKNKKVNPSYIFSSAQNNVLGLSIFLSFAFFQDWSNLNFVCLDDPIQNMDDINVFNFIDIIRSLIKDTDKQIYISTHDDRVYNFMLKKFRGNVQAFKFTKYGEVVEEIENI